MRRPVDTTLEPVRKALATLSMREEKILRMRFGIDEEDKFPYEEIARRFETTIEDIQDIESVALRKLLRPAIPLSLVP